MSWFFGWPLLVHAYNPLTAPYDPLTLFIVVPGGAAWLFLIFYVSSNVLESFITAAEARWPPAKDIREALRVIPDLVVLALGCIR